MTILMGKLSTSGGGVPSEGANLVRVSGDYQILVTDQYVISDGGNTLTLPLLANATQPVYIINEGVTNDTVDGNGSTVPNSLTISPTEVRGFAPGTLAWVEV